MKLQVNRIRYGAKNGTYYVADKALMNYRCTGCRQSYESLYFLTLKRMPLLSLEHSTNDRVSFTKEKMIRDWYLENGPRDARC